MHRAITSILGVVFVGLLVWFLWLTSGVYAFGLHLSSAQTALVHAGALTFSGLFVFNVVSSKIKKIEQIRYVYKLFHILVGLLFYFFPVAFMLGVIFAYIPLPDATVEHITVLGMIGALIFGIIGIAQTFFIKTTRYTVSIKGAPISWNNKKAVLVSDTHFGLVHHVRFSKKVASRIATLKPDFILHAGDFYDGPHVTAETITKPWKEHLGDIPVFYTPGNHEHYGNYEAFIQSLRDIGWKVLVDEKTVYDGVQIAGLQYRSKTQVTDTVRALNTIAIDRNVSSILINHAPSFYSEVESRGFSYMVSGHTHRGQFFPMNLITWILFGKYMYGLHRFKKLHALTSSGVGTAGPLTRLFNPPEIVLLHFNTT